MACAACLVTACPLVTRTPGTPSRWRERSTPPTTSAASAVRRERSSGRSPCSGCSARKVQPRESACLRATRRWKCRKYAHARANSAHTRAAGRTRRAVPRSDAPTASVVRSSRYGPTIWTPTGRPDAVRPTGTTVAGRCVSVASATQPIMSVYGLLPPSTESPGRGTARCGRAGWRAPSRPASVGRPRREKNSAISARNCSRFSLANTQSR